MVAPPGQTTGDGINPGLGDRELKVKNKNEVVQVVLLRRLSGQPGRPTHA